MSDIPKTIVLTGGSTGIGAAAARTLRSQGHHVVITGRSEETARLAHEIGANHFIVDFTRFSDVRKFADELKAKYPRIDVLVNNVGGIFSERNLTADGHEMTLQVNHLSGFLLTLLLRETLERSNAVVVNTSSIANLVGDLRFDDLESAKSYFDFRSYGTAKLMNILHAMEISRRFNGVHAVAFHPGPIATGFGREGGLLTKLIYETPLRRIFLRTPEQGADTLIWLINSTPGKDWAPGEHYSRRKLGRKNRQVTPANASKLWTKSLKLVGMA